MWTAKGEEDYEKISLCYIDGGLDFHAADRRSGSCGSESRNSASDSFATNGHSNQAPGCDFPGKYFVRSLLRHLSQRDQPAGRAAVQGCGWHAWRQWLQLCVA